MKSLLLIILLPLCCAADPMAQHYFPASERGDCASIHAVLAYLYSKRISSMDEPSLLEPLSSVESYRFTWKRSFHPAVIIRLEATSDGGASITLKVAGDGPSGLKRNEKREVTIEIFEDLRRAFGTAQFSSLCSSDVHNDGLDGSSWILEAVVDGKYHVVERFSPKEGPVRDIGMRFIEIGMGGEVAPIY